MANLLGGDGTTLMGAGTGMSDPMLQEQPGFKMGPTRPQTTGWQPHFGPEMQMMGPNGQGSWNVFGSSQYMGLGGMVEGVPDSMRADYEQLKSLLQKFQLGGYQFTQIDHDPFAGMNNSFG